MGLASLVAQTVKNVSGKAGPQVQSLGWKDSLEKGMATHSSILAWGIPWTKKPDALLFMGSQSWMQLRAYHFHSVGYSGESSMGPMSSGLSLGTLI